MPGPDGPAVATAKRLLDAAKQEGFAFQRGAPGEDGPWFGVRETLVYCASPAPTISINWL